MKIIGQIQPYFRQQFTGWTKMSLKYKKKDPKEQNLGCILQCCRSCSFCQMCWAPRKNKMKDVESVFCVS